MRMPTEQNDVIVSNHNMENYRIIIEKLLPQAINEVCIASSTLKNFRIFSHNNNTLSFSNYVKVLRNRGINVKILTTPKMLCNTFCKTKPTEIRACARNHLKLIIVDRQIMYFGTGNLTGAGVGIVSDKRRNFEIGIITKKQDWIKKCHNLFTNIWNRKYCSECKYKTRNLGCKI